MSLPTSTVSARRAEVRQIVRYLQSDLYTRSRDYSDSSYDIVPVEEGERQMLFGSPLGWRVRIAVGEDESLQLTIFRPSGTDLATSVTISPSAFNYDVAVNWLEDHLP